MKKLLVLLLVAILVPIVVAQKPVEVVPPARTVSLTTGETVSIGITIRNNQPFTDTFSFSVFPSFSSGISVTVEKTVITVEGNSEKTVEVYFSTPIDTPEGFLQFFISAKSLSTGVEDSASVILQTIKKVPMYISDASINNYVFKPEEKLIIETSVTNLHPKTAYTYELKTLIEKDKEIIQTFAENVTVQPRETVKVVNEYVFGKFANPGSYSITIYLKDEYGKVVSTKTFTINVLPVYKLPTGYSEKSTSIGFLSLTTTVVIKNEGNVGSPPFYISEELPLIARGMFAASVPPSNESMIGGSVVYSWYVPYLAPGESVVIQYHVSFVGLWIAMIVISAITYFSYRYTFKAAIVKSYHGVLKKDKEVLISLEMRNKTISEMKDVTVVDKVPAVVQVVEKFDTLPPSIKKAKGGTILTWSLGTLKPREERIVTYRIKPVVDVVGSLRLPAASMNYLGKKEIESAFSKSVIISPK